MGGTLDAIAVDTIDNKPSSLGAYDGKVRLVVNVASKCGLTPQYEGLEALYRQYKDKGLVVLGFPANDFAGQEPGTNDEIQSFCSLNYEVSFPLFAKLKATGADKHALYAELINQAPKPVNSDEGMRSMLAGHGLNPNAQPELLWNFEKFVIGRDGQVIARFSPDTKPDDPALLAVLEEALAAG